jgi:hypothetical protein
MNRNQQHDSELVALSTAALLTYHQVMGGSFEPLDVAQANAVMRDVARALSNVAPIYGTASATDAPKRLLDLDLVFGEFERGATVLRTRQGAEYRQLSIRRGDMRSAILILRYAGVSFAPPPAP